ncbi:MAG: hypothetical protein ACLQF1_17440, partial [Methyloceanibacter sp.]
MCALLQESLARPLPEPPEVLARQVGRLNDALLASHAAKGKANLQGLDRVVKILREPGRAHRFAAAGRSQRAETLRRAAPAINPLALPPPPFVRPRMAPQAIEKAQNAPANGAPLVALYSVHTSQIAARIPSPACWGRWRERASKDARLSTGYGAGWGVAR